MSYFHIKYGFAILVSILFLSCGSIESTADKQENYQRLKSIVKTGEFQIDNQFLFPMQGGQIDLTTNPAYMKFYGDSVSIHLPYFGTRTSGNLTTNKGGIVYEGLVSDLQVQELDNKQQLEISFECTARNEHLSFDIIIYSSGKATTDVKLSNRLGVSYQGILSKLKEEK